MLGWVTVAILAVVSVVAVISIGMPVDPNAAIDLTVVGVAVAAGSVGFVLYRWLERTS
jgi:hypothetical protein